MPLEVDTLCMLPDYNRFFLLARRAFVYQFLPERLRSVHVLAGPVSSVSKLTTIAEQLLQGAPIVRIEPQIKEEESPLSFETLREMNPLTQLVEGLPLCPSG